MSTICNFITNIKETDCIGQSLNTINNNFINTRNFICLFDNQLSNTKQQIDNISSTVLSISSQQLTKAWVLFNGHIDSNGLLDGDLTPTTPKRLILNQYNIIDVIKNGIGDYTITLPMTMLTADIYDVITPAFSAATNIDSSVSATILNYIETITTDTLPLTSISYNTTTVDISYSYNIVSTPTETKQTLAKSISSLVISSIIAPNYNFDQPIETGILTYHPTNAFPNISSVRFVTSNLEEQRFDPAFISLNFFN